MTSSSSSRYWLFRAFGAVAGDAPLPEAGVFRGNLALGGFLLVGAVVGLFLTWPGVRVFAAFQAIVAFTLLAGARDVTINGLRAAPVHRFSGIALVGWALVYVAFMSTVTISAAGAPQRISHAPGILALLVGYGFRLSAGPEAVGRSTPGVVGLVLGGCLDISVIVFMIRLFLDRA